MTVSGTRLGRFPMFKKIASRAWYQQICFCLKFQEISSLRKFIIDSKLQNFKFLLKDNLVNCGTLVCSCNEIRKDLLNL